MKSKHFTKSDRLWLYTLLKLIKNTAKIRNNVDEARCPKPEKKKKSHNPIAADILPRIANLFLMSKDAMNGENLQEYSEEINNVENVICQNVKSLAKKKVSFANNTKGCGDTSSEKCCGSPSSIMKKIETNNREIAKDIFMNQNIRKRSNHNSINLNGKRMGSSSDYLSLITLGNRLDNLKKYSSNTALNEGLRGSVNIASINMTKSLNPKRRKIHYELTKDSVRNIPFGFLTEIKDVVPGGVDEIIDGHTRRKVSKSGPSHSKKKQVTNNSTTKLGFKKIIENFTKVSDNSPKVVAEAKNTGKAVPKSFKKEEKTHPANNKKVMTNYRDVSSRLGDNYKRITMALQSKKVIVPGRGQSNGTTGELSINDSFEDLQSAIQGKKYVMTADVDGKRTKVLKKNYYIERMTLPGTNREVPNPFEPIKVSKSDNVEKVGKGNRVRKKKPKEGKDKMVLDSCECYLRNMLKDREPYFNRLGLKGV